MNKKGYKITASYQSPYAGLGAKKSSKRISFLHSITEALQNQEIYKGLPHSSKEEVLVNRARAYLLRGIALGYNKEYPGREAQWYEKKASDSLIWEHDTTVTLHHTLFLGTQHRPDMYVQHNNDYRIAIEYKMASSGDSLRAALGQALVYASDYEFTILLLCDTTPKASIMKKFDQREGKPEGVLVHELWKTFGIITLIVAPLRK